MINQFDDISGMLAGILALGWATIIGLFLLGLLLSTLFLALGLKAVKGENRGFGNVFLTALLNLIVSIIPCIGCILEWVIINARHKTGFGKAIVAWLIAGLIPLLIMLAILASLGVLGGIFGSIPFGT